MTADDGILRFYSDLSAWLDREVYSRADKLKWGEANISRAVYNYLFYVNMKRREEFINTPDRSINEVCITVSTSPPNLPYTYFLTWGAKFSKIFKRYSPKTEFHVTGRPGDIDPTGGHEAVTFFLQAPIFVSSEEYLIRMYGLVERVARRHPNIPVIMRPHPEIGISEREKKLERAFENVSIDICPAI